MENAIPPILQIGNVLLSADLLTERFCCDLDACRGACCVEGDAGAPVTVDEIAAIESGMDAFWGDLSAAAQSVIDRQGVAYADPEGELVTSIVHGKDCVFTCHEGLNCLCAIERAHRNGRGAFVKPISCALYPIREKRFDGGLIGLNYHRWAICEAARRKGAALGLPVYQFLKEPLIRRFGQAWYDELCAVAQQIENQ